MVSLFVDDTQRMLTILQIGIIGYALAWPITQSSAMAPLRDFVACRFGWLAHVIGEGLLCCVCVGFWGTLIESKRIGVLYAEDWSIFYNLVAAVFVIPMCHAVVSACFYVADSSMGES